MHYCTPLGPTEDGRWRSPQSLDFKGSYEIGMIRLLHLGRLWLRQPRRSPWTIGSIASRDTEW